MSVTVEKIEYDIDALKDGIGKAMKNIAIFEQAIEQERRTIKRFEQMIAVLEKDVEERRRNGGT